MRSYFRPWGWTYRPVSPEGVVLVLLALFFCATVVQAADRHAHSVSDFLYAIYPYVVTTLGGLNWIASKTSGSAPATGA